MPKPTASPGSLQAEGRRSAVSSFQMAYVLLSQITTEINTLLLSTSPPSSSFDQPPSDQPSHTLKLREDLEALQRMVRRIQAVLADAERREIHDESVRLWLRELSCLAYDADDILDEYNYHVLRPQVEAGFQSDGTSRSTPFKLKLPQEVSILTMASSSSSSSDGSTWNMLADRMRKIRLRFEEISRHREALHLREGAVRERPNVAVRQPSSHLPDTPTIFGREEIMEGVISMLLSLADRGEKCTLSVLPIVGMGGVGKTTLVQHVYNDQRVCGRFPSRGWVCVSDDFAVDSLTKRIFESLTGEACLLNEFDAIQRKLIQVLKRDQFLVVLDDVWNETPSFWDSLLKPFRLAGAEGSAVIVTTRTKSIARIVQTMPFHCLDCLSNDICWLIFEQHAFPGRDPANHMDLVPTGKKIVEKCKGLPLAVKVLASLLRNEFDRDRWEEILQSEVWHVPNQHDEIIPALRLSYLHLPSYLKPCFLYASVFPKDYKFGKERLVQLWMAQGFLQCEGRKQVEDIGNMYFDDLMQRSLFSPSHRLPIEKSLYVMHDLIHDLARHISEGEISSYIAKEEVDEDIFFPVGERKVDCLCPKKVRHLSISRGCSGTEAIKWVLQSCSGGEYRGIRSPLSIGNQWFLWKVPSQGLPDDDVQHKLPNEMMLNVESLRALELTYFDELCEMPKSMGYLRHLRYLNLQRTGIRKLPKTIGMLYNLQVLNLEDCKHMRSLPKSIGGLCNLRYLNLNSCRKLRSLPESIGGLCNLRYLNLNECWDLMSLPESMGDLCNLRYLNLNFCHSLRSLPESIGGLCNLQYLNLSECWRLRSLPESIVGLCNLRYLNLNCCDRLRSFPISIEGLHNLRYLNLEFCKSLRSLPESIGGLCNLRYLNLNECSNMLSLPKSIGGLCNLLCLEIHNEENYLYYPRGMSKLTNLRSLFGFTVASKRRGSGEVHGMELLMDMVHLRGEFYISGLANVVNPEGALMANLRNKEHIRQLYLDWGWGNGDNVGDNDDDNEKAYRVLENLRPPNGLEEMKIQNYLGIRFPSWMGGDASSFSRLTRVKLAHCRCCTLLPPLGQLPSLKCLFIRDASSVERVGGEFRGVGFPALEVLYFDDMPSWVTWDAVERGDFPRLYQLRVSECPKLQLMVPVYLFPALQKLQIRNCSSLPSIELRMPSSSSSSSIGPPPLVKMTISECPLARFSPEDEPLLLPVTLQDFSIDSACPLLLEWRRRDDARRRLAHIPHVDIPELETQSSDSCSDSCSRSSSSCDET